MDCGIKANDKIDYAQEKGIDVIICDHHLEGETLPKAVAILDPKRKGCDYPYKELSGCGVGFKLIQGYCKQFNLPDQLWLSKIDLVAISIASDIVARYKLNNFTILEEISAFFHEDLKFSRQQWDPTLKSEKYLFEKPEKAIDTAIATANWR